MRCWLSSAVLSVLVAPCLAPGVAAQRQLEEWPLQRPFPSSPHPTRAVALADVDGDSDLDAIVGNDAQHRLYLNRGGGTFLDATAARMPSAGSSSHGVALGDVDGDTDLDVVFANRDRQNQLYLNDGSGTFTDATATRLPPDSDSATAVILFDCDGDSDLDVVFANRDQQNRLYLNDGTGTFTDATASRMPAETDPTTSVAAGDVDGDGDQDLVLGNYNWRASRLYLNDGTGTFTDAPARMPSVIFEATGVALSDLDGDADLDVVVAYAARQNRLFLNDGTGTFADGSAGRLPTVAFWTSSVVVRDVDGDSDADIVFGNYLNPGRNELYLNDGAGRFTASGGMPADADETHALAVGDVDGDGAPDLLVGNLSPENRLYLNDGEGRYGDPVLLRFPVDGNDTEGAALGDVDGDGDLDVVFGNYLEWNTLYLNDGRGTFTDVTATRTPRTFYATLDLALGDVDGDGDLDVVVANAGVFMPRQNELYLNDGEGRFTSATARLPADQDSTTSVALGDVDGDGDLDIVFGNYGSSFGNSRQNRLYVNIGGARFTEATAGRIPPEVNETYALALADVDGDGDLDLAVANAPPRPQNRLFLNDGRGFFTNVTEGRMPIVADTSYALALGDVDGDGDPDMVIGNYAEQDRLYLNDGTGTFTDVTAQRMPPDSESTQSVALGDLDGDGDPDMVLGSWAASGPQRTRLYLNDGAGNFSDVTQARVMPDDDATSTVLLGDVDGDGDLDLVIGNHLPQNRLYTNLHRQLSSLVPARLGRPYDLQLHAEPGYGTSAHTGAVVLGSGLAAPPLSIPPLGSLYLTAPLLALPPVSIPASAGSAVVTLSVPSRPSLVGAAAYFQALIVGPAGPRLTGYVVDEVLR